MSDQIITIWKRRNPCKHLAQILIGFNDDEAVCIHVLDYIWWWWSCVSCVFAVVAGLIGRWKTGGGEKSFFFPRTSWLRGTHIKGSCFSGFFFSSSSSYFVFPYDLRRTSREYENQITAKTSKMADGRKSLSVTPFVYLSKYIERKEATITHLVLICVGQWTPCRRRGLVRHQSGRLL